MTTPAPAQPASDACESPAEEIQPSTIERYLQGEIDRLTEIIIEVCKDMHESRRACDLAGVSRNSTEWQTARRMRPCDPSYIDRVEELESTLSRLTSLLAPALPDCPATDVETMVVELVELVERLKRVEAERDAALASSTFIGVPFDRCRRDYRHAHGGQEPQSEAQLFLWAIQRAEDAVGEWQPKASAPKDGTHVLAFVPRESARHTHWIVGRFSVSGDFYSVPGGWTYGATHWRPLPPAPELKPETPGVTR